MGLNCKGRLLALPVNIKIEWNRLIDKDKHSSDICWLLLEPTRVESLSADS